jgi:Holliday junction resolvase-like predicted endonuclease
VKSKAGELHGDPLEMVTPVKVDRLRRAADAWLAAHWELSSLETRFDVIAVRAGRIEHVPDAF